MPADRISELRRLLAEEHDEGEIGGNAYNALHEAVVRDLPAILDAVEAAREEVKDHFGTRDGVRYECDCALCAALARLAGGR